MLLNEFLNSVVAHSCSSPRLVMVMIIIINDDVNDDIIMMAMRTMMLMLMTTTTTPVISCSPSFIESSRLGEGSHHLTAFHKTVIAMTEIMIRMTMTVILMMIMVK